MKSNRASQTYELVVAHYNESLNWLSNTPTWLKKTVYTKGASPMVEPSFVLPNRGREAHTYLYHIVNQYDALADYTVFCQGKPFDHAYDFHRQLRGLELDAPSDVFRWIGHTIDTDTPDGKLFGEWSKNPSGESLDIAGFYQELFGTLPPLSYPFVLGGQFMITRELVCRQPRAYYEKALRLSLVFPNAAHCFERLWDQIFGVVGIDRTWLGDRKTVHLKPIKRAAN
jgi:hypothetical protein